MRADRALAWTERALLGIGLGLGAWCAVVLAEARFVASLPVPSPVGVAASARPTRRPGAWVAKLDAPSVRLSATVLEGSDDATLARGAGHIDGTAYPWEPGNGNVGIAGHRDTTFRAVRNLHTGDPIEITTSDRIYRYRITKAFIVDPEDIYVLDRADEPMLTLVTCYPFKFIGHAPHRYIIQATLVSDSPRTG
jgi:sortase A